MLFWSPSEQVIFAGKTNFVVPKTPEVAEYSRSFFADPPPEEGKGGWHFTHTENRWANHDTTCQFVENCVYPFYAKRCRDHGKTPGKQKMMLLVDCWSGHCSDRWLEWMRLRYPEIILFFIPPNMTSVCQPADVGINKPWKARNKQKFNKWTEERRAELGPGAKIDLSMPAIRGPFVQWITESHYELWQNKELVKNAWRGCGLVSTVTALSFTLHVAMPLALDSVGSSRIS
jgi:hypothetical protein